MGALAAARLKLPTVITAGHSLPVKPAHAEGNAAVGATVAHGKDAAVGAAAEHQRNIKQHGGGELAGAQCLGAQGGIPVVINERGGGPLDGHARLCGGYKWHLGLTITLGAELRRTVPCLRPKKSGAVLGTYSTPALKGEKRGIRDLLGSWQISGIWTMETGTPFSISGGNGGNRSGSQEGGDRADVVGGQRLERQAGSKSHWLNEYFNTAAFTVNAVGTYGTSGRNIIKSPAVASADAAIMKNWEIQDRYHLQFRWEMFNAFNHPSFGSPGNDPSAPTTYGKILTTGYIPSRVMQGGLKLTF